MDTDLCIKNCPQGTVALIDTSSIIIKPDPVCQCSKEYPDADISHHENTGSEDIPLNINIKQEDRSLLAAANCDHAYAKTHINLEHKDISANVGAHETCTCSLLTTKPEDLSSFPGDNASLPTAEVSGNVTLPNVTLFSSSSTEVQSWSNRQVCNLEEEEEEEEEKKKKLPSHR